MRRECRECFIRQKRVSDPDINHSTYVTHVSWYMPGSLTSDFLWSRWRVKRSRCSWRMHNSHFFLCGKRPIWPGDPPVLYLCGRASWHSYRCLSIFVSSKICLYSVMNIQSSSLSQKCSSYTIDILKSKHFVACYCSEVKQQLTSFVTQLLALLIIISEYQS